MQQIKYTDAPRIARGSHTQLRLALQHIRDGLPVFPVNPRNKRPYNQHGHLEATTDEPTVRQWWARWPDALVAFPTGSRTGFWVLDVDGEEGRESLGTILASYHLERPTDLTPAVIETPSGGLHLYFRIKAGETPRTRAGDIGAGLDSRGEGGYITAAGNRRPDGKEYRLIGPALDVLEADFAPRGLVYLATFNRRERDYIAAQSELRAAVREAPAKEWPRILQEFREAEASRIGQLRRCDVGADAMRRQALHDLYEAASEYASRQDGRRNGLFSVACRLARYAAHAVIAEHELRSALLQAATTNGAIAAHGQHWFSDTIRRALAYGARDSLPIVARRFIAEVAA